MKIFSALAVLVALYFGPTAVMRAFDSDSKLGLFESEITGVSSEFMRRSPALKATYEAFGSCMQQDKCDRAEILAKRDRIIAAEWPAIFDRLAVRADWWSISDQLLPSGKLEQREVDREMFFEELRQKGADTLRNRCVPNITYRFDRRGNLATYDTAGFTCSPQLRRTG